MISVSFGQTWNLKLKSTVELRTWKLTNKAQEKLDLLPGATISLLKNGQVAQKVSTDANGVFSIDVHPNGDYILEVSYPGCNSKRFSISTYNVTENIFSEKYNPSFSIGGFVMAKPFQGIDYSGLSKPLVHIMYDAKLKNFNKDDGITNNGLNTVSNIAQKEDELVQKFCNYNQLGNNALAKLDCPLAKQMYQEAMQIISNEAYPQEQLLKTDICFKEAETNAKKLIEQKNAERMKDSLNLAIKEKTTADKKAKELEAINSAKIAKEKAEAQKIAQQQAQKDKPVAVQQKTVTAKPIAKPKEIETKTIKEEPIKPNNTSTETKSETSNQKKGESKYSMPQVLGANPYKDNMTKGNDYFKTKRYAEAKAAYELALKAKPNDAVATTKLNDCNLMLSKTTK